MFTKMSRSTLGVCTASYLMDMRALSLEVKQPGGETHHSAPFIAFVCKQGQLSFPPQDRTGIRFSNLSFPYGLYYER
jgi:hypothetical protein